MKKILILFTVLFSCIISDLYSKPFKTPKKNPYVLPKASDESKIKADTNAIKAFQNVLFEISSYAKKGLVVVKVSKTLEFPKDFPFEYFFGQKPPSQKQGGLGSGFFLDLKKGYIITNNHVIDGAEEISVKLANEEEYPASVVGKDAQSDLAIIKVKNNSFDKTNLEQLELGDSDKAFPGSIVVALGAPFHLEASITSGIISAIKRGSLNISQLGNFFQTDAAINPGNSGGPLLDVDGKVIGINTAIASRSGGSAGVGFAIPANLARNVANRLINHGSLNKGFLGVAFKPFEKEWAEILGIPKKTKGVVVTEVKTASPAEKSGIKKGDILTKIDGKTLSNPNDLINIIALKKPQENVNITLLRKHKSKIKEIKMKVTLGSWPDSLTPQTHPNKKAKNHFGIITKSPANLDEEFLQTHGLDKKKHVQVVTFVEKNSPADKALIKIGHVITLVNMEETPVLSTKQFDNFLKNRDTVVLTIETKEGTRIITLRKQKNDTKKSP